jgi:site-specific recombinase XerD
MQKTIDQLSLDEISDQLILNFLDHLEKVRHNQPQTRNNRLAALRSFFRFIALHEPELVPLCERICAIKFKRTTKKVIEPLHDDEVTAFLEAIDQSTLNGKRDYALILLLYNTGARVQEIVDLKWSDIRDEEPFTVKFTGKGKKERIVPLWQKTITAIKLYLEWRQMNNILHDKVFLNKYKKPLTRFGIRTIIQKYTTLVRNKYPAFCQYTVSPHTFRHTAATHMIQAGVDVTVVKDFLGHADINTTCHYITINLDMKRKALEESERKINKNNEISEPKWQNDEIMRFLNDLSRKKSVM